MGICHERLRPLPVRRGDYARKLRASRTTVSQGKSTKNVHAVAMAGISRRPMGYVPFSSSFLVLRLNCFHHEAKSRFEGGELEPGSGEVGSGTGSAPECDLLTVTMANPGDSRYVSKTSRIRGRLGHRLGKWGWAQKNNNRGHR